MTVAIGERDLLMSAREKWREVVGDGVVDA